MARAGIIGSSQHWEHVNLGLNKSLRKVAERVALEESQKLKDARAKKAAKSRVPVTKILLTDEQVLECRTLAEREGWGLRALARRFNTSTDYIRRLLDYQTRAQPHLDPSLQSPR